MCACVCVCQMMCSAFYVSLIIQWLWKMKVWMPRIVADETEGQGGWGFAREHKSISGNTSVEIQNSLVPKCQLFLLCYPVFWYNKIGEFKTDISIGEKVISSEKCYLIRIKTLKFKELMIQLCKIHWWSLLGLGQDWEKVLHFQG